MHVQFINTISVDETRYIDLCAIDGQLITFLMHKIAEPNVFGVLKQEQGDTSRTITDVIEGVATEV